MEVVIHAAKPTGRGASPRLDSAAPFPPAPIREPRAEIVTPAGDAMQTSSSSFRPKPPASVATAQTAVAPKPIGPVAFITISDVLLANPTATAKDKTALLIKRADDCGKVAKAMGSNSCFVWDASGDMLQTIQYMGEPAIMPPGVNIDTMRQFFQHLHSGGGFTNIGITLRPGWVVKDATGRLVYTQADQYTWCLLSKMAWARKNYGPFINNAYCDSTIDSMGLPLNNEPLVLLNKVMPDVTWVLENVYRGPNDDRYKPWNRFCDPRGEVPIPDDGFVKLVGDMDAPDETRFDEFVAAAKRGDRLMYYGWQLPGMAWNDFIKRVYIAVKSQ